MSYTRHRLLPAVLVKLSNLMIRTGHVPASFGIFPTPVYLAPPLKGFPLEFDIGARGQKTRMMGLPGGR